MTISPWRRMLCWTRSVCSARRLGDPATDVDGSTRVLVSPARPSRSRRKADERGFPKHAETLRDPHEDTDASHRRSRCLLVDNGEPVRACRAVHAATTVVGSLADGSSRASEPRRLAGPGSRGGAALGGCAKRVGRLRAGRLCRRAGRSTASACRLRATTGCSSSGRTASRTPVRRSRSPRISCARTTSACPTS